MAIYGDFSEKTENSKILTYFIDGNFFDFSKMYTNKKVKNFPKFSQKTAINFSKIATIWREYPREEKEQSEK